MSEADRRAQMERSLIKRSLEDDVFRQQLLADPKAIIERDIGRQLPEEVRVVAMEETADTIYLVLPYRSTDDQETGELSDQELQGVAGGVLWGSDTANENTCAGDCSDPTWPNACE
jgi:hypothetical protein